MEKYFEKVDLLSEREKQVFNFLINGGKTTEIASLLNLKSNTISTVKKSIFKKFNCTNIIQLNEIYNKNYNNNIRQINNEFFDEQITVRSIDSFEIKINKNSYQFNFYKKGKDVLIVETNMLGVKSIYKKVK